MSSSRMQKFDKRILESGYVMKEGRPNMWAAADRFALRGRAVRGRTAREG
jgi:hypothetical protein